MPTLRTALLLVAALASPPSGRAAQGPAPLATDPPELAAELGAELAPLVEPWVGSGCFPGLVVGVARGDERWMQGFGETALGSGRVPDALTLYEIGSLSKVYTGYLLADAHLRGVARLEDTLAEHLPRGTTVPSFGGTPIRLVHLATHSAGIGRLPSNLHAGAPDPYADYGADELYAGLAAARVAHAPGERYAYSNFGFGALGHALARAEGVGSYDELCLARLAVVHGLDDTRVVLSEAQRARLAPPHDAALLPGTSWGFGALAGAGGLRASTADLLRFAGLFLEGASHAGVPAAALTLAVHGEPAGGPPMGLGWHHAPELAERAGLAARAGLARLVAHEGQTGGYHSVLLVAPHERLAVTMLANAPCDSLGQLGAALLVRARGGDAAPRAFAPILAGDDPSHVRALQELPGTYRVGPFDSVVVEAQDGALLARRRGGPRMRLHPVGGDRYEYRVISGAAEVLRDADGAVTGLSLVDGERRETARRR